MKRIRQKNLPPDQRNWLERPKHQRPDGSTIAFFLGILVLIGIIYLAVITPDFIYAGLKMFLDIDLPTQYQINGITYDTKKQMVDFFRNLSIPKP